MPTSDALYRLVIFEAPEDPRAVRDLFSNVTGTHPIDAMQWVARTPGLWAKPLSQNDVRALLDGLFDLGVPAEAWRADVVPDFGHVRTVHEVACLDEGFRANGLHGEPTHWIPWNKFELVSAGRIAADDEYRDVAPPTWIGAARASARFFLGRKPIPLRSSRASRIPRDPNAEVLLVREAPFLALRIVAPHMNYAYLGDRIRESSAENFPLLLADIVERASSAFITQPTKLMLASKEPDGTIFSTSQSLSDYSLNRLLWSWYRRDRDAEQQTQA